MIKQTLIPRLVVLTLAALVVATNSAVAKAKHSKPIESINAPMMNLECSEEETLAIFQILIDTNKMEYLGQRARYFQRIGKFEKSISDFDKAVELDPEKWLGYRAKLNLELGRTEQAIIDYLQLIDLTSGGDRKNDKLTAETKSTLAHVYWRRGLFFRNTQQPALAMQDLQEAASLDKTFLPNLADFAEECGDKVIYKSCLDLLIEVDPTYYLVKRAQFFERERENVLALSDLDRAVAVSEATGPKAGYSPRAWALFARKAYFTQVGDFAKANCDDASARKFERRQRLLFGFSAWPQ